MNDPVLLEIDGYKSSHPEMEPDGVSMVYSNFTPRTSRMKEVDSVVCFGFQYFCREWLVKQFNETFFDLSEDEAVAEYERVISAYLGHPINVDKFRALHRLGYLPLELKALPEGIKCPLRVPVLTLKNTHPDFAWLVGFLETLLSNSLWHPMTVATISNLYANLLNKYAEETSDDLESVKFAAHDFGLRGMTSSYSGKISGMAHLLSSVGTDCIPCLRQVEKYYDADITKELIGCGVAATEHQIAQLYGKDNEFEYFRNLLVDKFPTGIISLVGDTYNYWAVFTDFLPRLKNIIECRNGKVVIRGDSGDPVDIICGKEIPEYFSVNQFEADIRDTNEGEYSAIVHMVSAHKYVKINYTVFETYDERNEYYVYNEITSIKDYERTPEEKGTIELLWEIFGGKVNSKGYKELNPCIAAIYGDSITLERAEAICRRLKDKGFASTNVVYGVGSFSFQYVTRDTFGFAFKATAAVINGELRAIFKDPLTDIGSVKKSAKGLLMVYPSAVYNEERGIWEYGPLELIENVTPDIEQTGFLRTIFKDGILYNQEDFATIRRRLGAIK